MLRLYVQTSADQPGLLERINVRHSSLTKNARNTILKAASAAASSSSDSPAPSSTQPYPLPLPAGSTLPIAHLSQKEQQAVTKILTEFDKVHALQDEKIHLAERMERIVLRAKERGRAEWLRVGGKDVGELDRDDGGSQRGSKAGTPVGEGMVGGLAAGLGMERPQKSTCLTLSQEGKRGSCLERSLASQKRCIWTMPRSHRILSLRMGDMLNLS